MRDIGFTDPIICDSGNGFHLLYKISIENTKESKELIQSFLVALDMFFLNKVCNIDKTVFNASRISKLYGTISKKGNNTPERPHRESKIIRFPEEIKETSVILIHKVVDSMPVIEKPTYTNNYNAEKFDLRSFISKHGINVTDEHSYSGGCTDRLRRRGVDLLRTPTKVLDRRWCWWYSPRWRYLAYCYRGYGCQ